MKKNFDIELKNVDGTPFGGKEPILMKKAIISALGDPSNHPDEQNLKAEDKLKRWKLSLKVQEGGEKNYTTEEVALIKEAVGRNCVTIVVGQIFEYVEK